MSELWEARRELHVDPPKGGPRGHHDSPNHQASPFPCDCGCGTLLTWGQIRRGAHCASAACRSRLHEARDPRVSNASIEQLEAELLKRLGAVTSSKGEAPNAPTVRALTRNVRVLKLTWMKVRSMTPSRSTFMQTLEKIVHEAWVKEDTP